MDNITIKVISEACGILPQTLRAWESRYQAFTPERTDSGKRLYSDNDLKRACVLAQLLKRGFTISQVATLSLEELQKSLEGTQVDISTLGSQPIKSFDDSMERVLDLVADFQFDLIVSEFNHWRTILSIRDFLFKIVLRSLQEVGMKVAAGELSITQEHILSTIVRGQLGEIKGPLQSFIKADHSFNRYALATPEGNIHELSLIIADLLCNINRRKTHYLGAAHPADCLGQAVSALGCDKVILGAISSEQWVYEKNLPQYLETLDRNLTRQVDVIIGGGRELPAQSFKNIKNVFYMESLEDFDYKLQHALL